ncbi:hypothetical protein [Acaryochloris marina]|uniref:Uncharacterized protein n=1 Tax=Acaryochloris marina (strain MBIC 11017) TaxID=329726 RepID=B0CB53_ACAM1|nr:hypothetical protein [Acaryochloris marina]ABW26692.1 hypothetical protein AM1_1671 [Acaryochloris marina MBIC11017]BDM81478.1 hypothetical protein AM10699_43450 [Acaryochloris marina MBIC10699]
MWLQPAHTSPSNTSSCKLPALISPRGEHTQEEIVNKLQQSGAENLKIPASGFISAEINPEAVKALEDLAIVEIKQAHQMYQAPQKDVK